MVNRERLTKFIQFLRTRVPDDHFNFGTYIDTGKAGKTPSLTECGSVGCAVGWLPAYDPEAFRWLVGPNDYGLPEVVLRAEDDGHRNRDIYAAQRYFELTYEEALFLFVPHSEGNGLRARSSVAEVARNMERFLAEGMP